MALEIKSEIPAKPEEIIREEPFTILIDNVKISSRLLNTIEYENLDIDFRKLSFEQLIYDAVIKDDNNDTDIKNTIKNKLLKSGIKGFRKLISIILKYSHITNLTWYTAFTYSMKQGIITLNPYVYWIMTHVTIDELTDYVYYYIQYNISIKKKLLDLYRTGVKAYPAKPTPLVSTECVPNLSDFHSLGEWI